MHEFSLVDSILRIAVERAAAGGAKAITRVCLRVGPLSGAVPESLEFAFEALRDENPLTAGATLAIERTVIRCRCPSCQSEFTADVLRYACPSCGEGRVDIVSGRELEVVSLEIETP